jgi:hypothetical protein
MWSLFLIRSDSEQCPPTTTQYTDRSVACLQRRYFPVWLDGSPAIVGTTLCVRSRVPRQGFLAVVSCSSDALHLCVACPCPLWGRCKSEAGVPCRGLRLKAFCRACPAGDKLRQFSSPVPYPMRESGPAVRNRMRMKTCLGSISRSLAVRSAIQTRRNNRWKGSRVAWVG